MLAMNPGEDGLAMHIFKTGCQALTGLPTKWIECSVQTPGFYLVQHRRQICLCPLILVLWREGFSSNVLTKEAHSMYKKGKV